MERESVPRHALQSPLRAVRYWQRSCWAQLGKREGGVMKPKTTYDVRRHMTLVAILAQDDDYTRDYGLHALMKYWGIKWKSEYQLHPDRLISALAQHVVKYHRTPDSTNPDDTVTLEAE
jgi:hypothetical protein